MLQNIVFFFVDLFFDYFKSTKNTWPIRGHLWKVWNPWWNSVAKNEKLPILRKHCP